MKTTIKALSAALILGSIWQCEVQAAPVTINISANVTQLYDYANVLGSALSVGGKLTGSYTYDTATSDSNSISTVGDFQHTSSTYGISLSGGGFQFKTDPNNVNFLVELVNNHGATQSDNYLLRSYNNLSLSNGVYISHIAWQLDGKNSNALSSTDLTTHAPDLTLFNSSTGLTIQGCLNPMMGHYCSGNEFFLRAIVTSAISDADAAANNANNNSGGTASGGSGSGNPANSVPTPSPLMLLSSALTGLGLIRRRPHVATKGC